MIRLIAIDIDGTLLTSQNVLTAQTKAMIHQIKSEGVRIVLCTGRPFRGIQPLLQELELNRINEFAISFNGAVIHSLEDESIIFHESLSFDSLKEIEQLSQKLNIKYHIQSDDGIYTSNRDISPYTAYDSYLNHSLIKYRELNELASIAINKVMFVAEPSKIETIMGKIPNYFQGKYNLMRSLDFFYEFLSINANKGQALAQLAKELEISSTEILAIGDNDNDASMLEFAGIGIAMGNASQAAKEKATYITKNNDEEGVAFALQQYWINEIKNK